MANPALMIVIDGVAEAVAPSRVPAVRGAQGGTRGEDGLGDAEQRDRRRQGVGQDQGGAGAELAGQGGQRQPPG